LIISNLIKDPDEQTEEDVDRMRSGKVPSIGVSVLVLLGCTNFLAHE
jgi:hypothetical protein